MIAVKRRIGEKVKGQRGREVYPNLLALGLYWALTAQPAVAGNDHLTDHSIANRAHESLVTSH